MWRDPYRTFAVYGFTGKVILLICILLLPSIIFCDFVLCEESININKNNEESSKEIIVVKVTGVEGKLLSNIYNTLSIYKMRKNYRVDNIAVNQLYRMADKEIKKAVAPFGYYNSKITSNIECIEEKTRKGGRNKWRVHFEVKKGVPVIIEDVAIRLQGDDGVDSPLLLSLLKGFALKKGDILNQQVYEQEKKKLLNAAMAEGFLEAAFRHSQVRVDPGENRAWIDLLLDTGKIFRFGHLVMTNIDGETGFNTDLLRGYLPWKKGDAYSLDRLFELQSVLNQTDYFKQVAVAGKKEAAYNGYIPVEVSLKIPEAKNKYTLGGGYATDTGARVKFNWKNRLFNSRGDKIGAYMEIAEQEKNLAFSFERPMISAPRYDRFIAVAKYQDQNWEDTTTRLFTASIGRNYFGPEYTLGAGSEIRREDYAVGDTSGSSVLLVPSVSGGFVLTDEVVSTAYGLRFNASAKGAIESLVSDVTFLQWTVGGKLVLTPAENWRLLGRASFGMTLVDDIDDIPPSLRFYAGGDNSVRGFAYKSVGPEDSSGAVVGGKYLTVQSVEVERLIGGRYALAAFWDIGTATNDLRLDYEQGAGLGFRVRLPFGEIKLDVATALTESGNPIRLHLSVGGIL